MTLNFLRLASAALAGALMTSFAAAAPITDYYEYAGFTSQLPDVNTSFGGTSGNAGTMTYNAATGDFDIASTTGGFGFGATYSNGGGTTTQRILSGSFIIGANFGSAGGKAASQGGTATGTFTLTGTPQAGFGALLSGAASDPILAGTLVAVGTVNGAAGGAQFIWEVDPSSRAAGIFGNFVYTIVSSGSPFNWSSNMSFSNAGIDNLPGRVVPAPAALPLMLGALGIFGLLARARRA